MSLGLGAMLALAALGAGPDGTGASPPDASKAKVAPKPAVPAAVPIENRPYKIRAWLAVDPRARVDGRGRAALVAGWKVMASRFVGSPWDLEIAEGDGPLATNGLDDVTPEMVIPEAKGFDKAWLIRLEPDAGGLSLAGREFDAETARIGLLCRRPTTVLADAPRALLQLSLDIFAPSAEIAEAAGGGQKIRVQGAMLPAADPIGQVVSVGSVFRPTRIFYKPDGGIQLVTPIKKTYLRVEALAGGVATCKIESALGNPFTTKVVGKAKMVAVGLKPASIPTRLRFLLTTLDTPAVPGTKPEPRPAAGYDLVAINLPNGTPRPVGTTDREGRIVLEPGFSDGLVSLRLMAAGIEPLIQFPVMPGEQVEENVIANVDPRPVTVTAESDLYSLRDEIVDLIAVRHRLEAKIKARAEADTPNWDDIRQLLDEFKALPPKAGVEGELTKLKESLAAEQQKNNRRKIRTVTAQKLIGDTEALIERYLDDETFLSYEDAWQRYKAQAATAKDATKALPKAPAFPSGGAAPSANASGLLDFAPPGAGFRVGLPGAPTESNLRTPDGASEIKSYRLQDPTKGVFSVEYWDYPLALTPDEAPRVIDSERDRQGAAFPNGKIVAERAITLDGRAGKEVEWEVPGAKGAAPTGYLCRIATVNSRIFCAGYGGPKAALTGKPASDFFASFRLTAKGGGAAPNPAPAQAASGSAATPPASTTKPKTPKAPSPASRPKNPGGATPF